MAALVYDVNASSSPTNLVVSSTVPAVNTTTSASILVAISSATGLPQDLNQAKRRTIIVQPRPIESNLALLLQQQQQQQQSSKPNEIKTILANILQSKPALSSSPLDSQPQPSPSSSSTSSARFMSMSTDNGSSSSSSLSSNHQNGANNRAAIVSSNSAAVESSSSSLSASISSANNTPPEAVHMLAGVEQQISSTSRKKIDEILTLVSQLKDIEKLYLYFRLPDGSSSEDCNDKKKGIYNPFGKKTDTEIVQTYTWIQSHLEEDSSVSIPKHEVYEDYSAYCGANKIEKLCVADFGKAMKHVFPQVKPRRLGQRGSSKYCYSGLKKRLLVDPPELPLLDTSHYKAGGGEEREKEKSVDALAWKVIQEWAEKTFNRKFKHSLDLARYIKDNPNIMMNVTGKVGKNNEQAQQSPQPSTAINDGTKLEQLLNAPMVTKNEIDRSILPQNVALTSLNLAKVPNQIEQFRIVYANGNGVTGVLASPTSSTIRYKPIQPKKSVETIEQSEAINNQANNDKRRHSVATPFQIETASNNNLVCFIPKPNDQESGMLKCYASDSKIANEDRNFKRQFEERDMHLHSKKRHVESGELCMAHNNSKMLSNLNLKPSTDLKINELENEALRDYLNNQTAQLDGENVLTTLDNKSGETNQMMLVTKQDQQALCNGKLQINESLFQRIKLRHHSNDSALAVRSNLLASSSELSSSAGIIQVSSTNSIPSDNHLGRNAFLANQAHSPDSRLVAFNFQPISARHTPTIPENSPLELGNVFVNGQTIQPNRYQSNGASGHQQALPMSLSQCSSATNSPFVSPRDTPVPLACRSRHGSGQNGNFANLASSACFRSTTQQSFDSGISSVSSGSASSFLSPQSTPTIRNLLLDSSNHASANRARHSSGPGGPVANRMTSMANLMINNRSNSLSPMVTDGNVFVTSNNLNQWRTTMATSNVRHVNSLDQQHPVHQEQLVEHKIFNQDLMDKLNMIEQQEPQQQQQHQLAQPKSALNPSTSFSFDFVNYASLGGDNSSHNKQRQRHQSAFCGVAPYVKEEPSDLFRLLVNRSHSVPVHQMFDSNSFDDSSLSEYSIAGTGVDEMSSLTTAVDFKLPQLTLNQNDVTVGVRRAQMDELLSNVGSQTHDNILQGDQDVIVSSVQLGMNNNDLNGHQHQHQHQQEQQHHLHQQTHQNTDNVDSPLMPMVKNDVYTDLLGEHFSSMSDYRDCDNDFSGIDLGGQTTSYEDYLT